MILFDILFFKESRETLKVFHWLESVSVAIKEVEPEDRVEKVYKPDIQNKWEKLYKKPGYELSDL